MLLLVWLPPVQGMSRVEEFSTDLKTTTFLLRTSRQHLEQARKGLTGGGMEIVAKARKLRVLQVRLGLRSLPCVRRVEWLLMCASPPPRYRHWHHSGCLRTSRPSRTCGLRTPYVPQTRRGRLSSDRSGLTCSLLCRTQRWRLCSPC